jgi:predicted ribosome quality control (RQC) complex YloA/Tae2 family protein
MSDDHLIPYRLDVLETKVDQSLEKLSDKFDRLILKYGSTKEQQALASQSIENVTDSIEKLEKRINQIEKDLVSVRITVAEKIMYGGVGGALVAGIIQGAQLLLS